MGYNFKDFTPEELDRFKRMCDRMLRSTQASGNARALKVFEHAALMLYEHNNPHYLTALMNMSSWPVTIDEFIESKDFLGHDPDFNVWPSLRDDLRGMNPDIWTGQTHIFETFDGGATSTGKALDVDTLIPVPGGYKRMGDLNDGEQVFAEDGSTCTVVKAHTVMLNRPCYEVIFDDGASLIADHEHLWVTFTESNRRQGTPATVKTTDEIRKSLKTWRGTTNHRIRLAKATQGAEADLPSDPYTLGAWLGDGGSMDALIWGIDVEIIDEIRKHYPVTRKHYTHDEPGDCPRYRIEGYRGILGKLKVLGNKHIPNDFMCSEKYQRIALLQGLMDTDGTVDKRLGRCTFSNKNFRLIEQTKELCASLGLKPSISSKEIKGVTYYEVGFTPMVDFPIFRLKRKQKYVACAVSRASELRMGYRSIVAVNRVKSRPVRCITVDSPSRLYLAGKAYIPTHNTHKAHITQLYQLYTLCCFPKPVKLWPRLSSNTPLLFFFQSVQERITKRVIYEPFRNMFTQLPYVRRHVTWDKDKETVLELGNGVQVIPALASLNNIVGQAIVSGILDEVNFMSVVEESKQVVGARGQGGLFDQAQIVYNNITRRRKSRFITKGPSPGIISVLSSVRYLGDFMDRRLQQYEAVKDTEDEEIHTFVMRRAQYHAHPPDDYSGVTFRLLVGSTEYGTRVLKEEEVAGRHYPLNARVEEVPVEYKQDFLRDPEGALRDVCGIATDVISPYITQRHKIIAAITRGKNRGMKPWVLDADIDLANSEEGVSMMPQIIEENLPKDRGTPRYVHVDLSISGDRCGIAIVKVSGYKQVTNVDHVIEHLPHYVLEQGITIKPNTAHELDIAEVRRWIMSLKSYYGINIAVVTYDGFQSRESIQLLRKAGVPSMHVSVDSTMDAYDTLKVALYQDRIDFQDHELLKVELSNLEYNAKKKKVDHSPKGSKDLSDAVAGAVYSASISRNVRGDSRITDEHGIEPGRDAQGRMRVSDRPRSPHRRVRQ